MGFTSFGERHIGIACLGLYPNRLFTWGFDLPALGKKSYMTTPTKNKTELAVALQLLMEAREACAALFRVIAATKKDPTIIDRLDAELKKAGVEDGFGVRIQTFVAKHK